VEDAVGFATAAVVRRQGDAVRAVRAWPAGLRRLAAVRVHINAVRHSRDGGPPDDGPARLMPVLIDERMRWSRSDLAWALRTADNYLLFDGAAFLLPGYMAVSLGRAELHGFEPALREVFDEFIDEQDIPRWVRKLLAELYGTAIGRCVAGLPLDLLTPSDPFGRFTRKRLGRRLEDPDVTDLLRHAAALSKPVPPKTWLRSAEAFAASWPVRAVLDCFVEYAGYVPFASDELLRGLAWMLSLDQSEQATELLALVAMTAGTAAQKSRGYPFAPQTAAATVEILASRPGEVPVRVLTDLSHTVANKALRARVETSLQRVRTAIP
jgi:hypothetical protein